MKGSNPSSAAAGQPTRSDPTSASPHTPELRDRFVLTGTSNAFDPRTDAVRKDIADIGLSGRLFAPHYAVPLHRACGDAAAMLRRAESHRSEAISQLLPGEPFHVVDLSGGWAWGYCGHDHYVGYVETAALADPIEATHRVDHSAALIFETPDIRSQVIGRLPLGAHVSGISIDDFLETGLGFIHRRHVRPVDDTAVDPVRIAETMTDAPYLWGGRGGGGVDCSGLVQTCYALAGVDLPRDSDQQAVSGCDAGDAARRGDLVFFPGHVAIMVDGADVIHASAHWMSVVIEPLADLAARSEPMLSRRRVLP